jgi:hypothetical protein
MKPHAIEIYNNLINPAIVSHAKQTEKQGETETGYKSSERAALENQLLQIETVARVVEEHESAEPDDADASADE